nr:MASE3 domain-containing protein [Pedobacter sp. SYSU D00535]
MFSIVITYALFIITWNARKTIQNQYLYFVGIAYLFVGFLDLLHTLTYKGMNIFTGAHFYANQFWIATRFLEVATLLVAFRFLNSRQRLHGDLILLIYACITAGIILSILHFKVFPACYIEGYGQTDFKIYGEYVIIAMLVVAVFILHRKREHFKGGTYHLLLASLIFTIISEFCFSLYISNYGLSNQIGHYAKLVSFFLIYKANVETGFTKPTQLLFDSLSRDEQKYRTLSENLPELIVRFNSDLQCIYVNRSFQSFVPDLPPLSQGQVFCDQLFPGPLYDTALRLLQEARQSGAKQESQLDLEIEGRAAHLLLTVIPETSADGREKSFLVIGYNITRQHAAHLELQELNKAKDKLFSIIAHDLKNPFTSILTTTELLSKSGLGMSAERLGSFLNIIHKSVRESHILLTNLLEWARMQTGALEAKPEKLSVHNLLLIARQTLESVALTKGITIMTEIDREALAYADEQMVQTILRNLLSNAIKFSPIGSQVLLKAETEGNFISISVIDRGMGIPPDVVEAILSNSQLVPATGTANELGTGLGLTLCKEMTEKNGGKLKIDSKTGKGSTFSFNIPIFSA